MTPTRTAAATSAAALALLLAPGALASGPGPRASQELAEGVRTTVLSNPSGTSRWAYPTRAGLIRSRPRVGTRVRGRLRLLTEDGLPDVYLLQARRQGPGGEDWVKLGIPGRPNGRTGWVPRDALGSFRRTITSVTVSRKLRRVSVRRNGKRVARFQIGIGKPGTPTPAGRFWIREKFRVAGRGSLYGPRALGTSAYAPYLTDWPSGGVVGFHGTNQPGLLPGRVSHGCIRLRNKDILRFYRLVGVGTPVTIR